MPSNVMVAKIMSEITRLMSSVKGEGNQATACRNSLRFRLENNDQQPPRTVKVREKFK